MSSAVVDLPEEQHPDRVRLRFLQSGEDRAVKEARVLAGTTIFDAASWNGVAIDSTCGGHGTCKKCKVKVVSGNAPVSPVDPSAFSIEELKNGWLLACRANTHEDLTVEVPPLQTRPKAALAGVGRHVILRPAVQKRYVELDEATLEDQQSDLERLLAAMDDLELRVPLDIVRELGGTLRRADWKVTAVVADDLLIDVEPGDTSGRRHAIAFDLGTTTVVATLLDLETGQPQAVQSILNAQQPFGADVISRISAIMMDDGALEMLQRHAHETLQKLTDEVCEEAGVEPNEVYEVVVAGNMTMIQIALGIDPEPLSMAPFTVVARRMPHATAADFGVRVHPRAPAVMFPALGAYVGPDIVAGVPDHSGRCVLDSSDRLGKLGEENVFYLSDDVFFSQRDVRELQFAKASIATGWTILCKDLGLEPGEISQVLLGGSFGSYLSAASAVKIGLVPKLPLARIVSAGNVAGEGAKIAALSVTERAAAHAILEEVEYVELSGRTDFNDLFVDQLRFPE